MTYLCVAIFVTDAAQARRDAIVAQEQGADLVELRIDTMANPDAVRTLLADFPVPCILTCRANWEGGQSELGDEERFKLLEAGASASNRYIDIELKALQRTPAEQRPPWRPIIASYHDFTGRPTRLNNILMEMSASPASIHKIVWMARTVRDNIEAFEILQQRSKPTIALCMGEAGLISRVLAKKFGAFLTFASLHKDGGTAAGQIPLADMKQLYRWDAIRPTTRVYGVVGSPVGHSMSPAIHNAAFAETGVDGIYVPLLVNEGYESFKAFMESFVPFEALHLSGLSVTIPHKENALRYLTEKGAKIEPLAATIGAVNTIVIDRTPAGVELRGFSSDYAAILDSITTKLGITRQSLVDYRVAVMGAGGTGRTAVAALAHYGATVVVYNRTLDRAEALADEFTGKSGKVVAAKMEKLCDSCCHIYLNTTSVGMHPKIDESPVGEKPLKWTSDTLVFDCIYNPMQTMLLRQAKAAGAKTIGGVEMFVRQGAAQFEAWTGRPAPVAVMRNVVEERLTQR